MKNRSSKWSFARSKKRPFTERARLLCEALEPRHLLAANPIISEFMASNNDAVSDGFGAEPDWIEIYNAGDTSVDLQGYHLTDSATDLAKWSFPTTTPLGPDEYLLVFASGKDVTDPADYHHTNFKLSAGGEYVALVAPDNSVLSEFGDNGVDYPPQFTDISYGLQGGTILNGETLVDYLVPVNGNLSTNWTNINYNASIVGFEPRKAAIGYENNGADPVNYSNLIETVVPSGTRGVYLRHEFEIDDVASVTDLDLNLKSDDGFVVYLNGQVVLSERAPASPVWNSTAISTINDSIVVQGTDYDLSGFTNLLQNGTNVLAIHALNESTTSSDFLIVPELTIVSQNSGSGYLAISTPGADNGALFPQGPIIREIAATPEVPVAGQPLLITAEIYPFPNAIDPTSVTMTYRQMYGAEFDVAMNDNGLNGDTIAGDGTYTATIPGSAVVTAEMIRWYVTADDIGGETSRAPRFLDPLDSAEYYGAVAPDPTATSDAPVLYWFVEDLAAARTREGARSSISYRGTFYDNIQTDLHGQSTAGSDFPKKSFDFDSNSGEKFDIADGLAKHSDFNLLNNYADQTKLRHPLAYDVFTQAGVSAGLSYTVAVHRNGSFAGLWDFVEEGDEEQLRRLGLDETNPYYKINNNLTSTTTNVEQKAGIDESRTDLQEVVNGNGLSGTAARTWDWDHLDIADWTNYLAVMQLIRNQDFGHKNMYWYHDASGTDLWTILPWDVDLSFGHNWTQSVSPSYFDNTLYVSGGLNAGWNNIIQRLINNDPNFESMLNRRIRTLMDDILGPPGSSTNSGFLAQEFAAREAVLQEEILADNNLWGIQSNYSSAYPFTAAQAVDEQLNTWIPQRRSYLEGLSQIPDGHNDSSDIQIGQIEHDPTSGDLNEQYIAIENNENYAVDISNWTLDGAMQHTFKPGTVIPANGTLYLAASVPGFIGRTLTPSGGQQRFVQGGESGTINPTGGVLELANPSGVTMDSDEYGVTADFNNNGVANCSDLNFLSLLTSTNAYDANYDLSGDGVLDLTDIDMWLAQASVMELGPGGEYRYGDANLDGQVDTDDFGIWNANRFENGKQWCGGDFNVDGLVDVSDLNIWSENRTPTVLASASSTDAPAASSLRIPRAAPPAMVVEAVDAALEDPTLVSIASISIQNLTTQSGNTSERLLTSEATASTDQSSQLPEPQVLPMAASVSSARRTSGSSLMETEAAEPAKVSLDLDLNDDGFTNKKIWSKFRRLFRRQ